MLETLKILLFTFGCYGAALLIAGTICLLLASLFNHGPDWLKITVVLCILGVFAYGVINGIIDSETNTIYYYDGPPMYEEGGSDRYR